MKDEIIEFLKNRPGVIGAYGYGSGIVKQSGYNKKDKPQLDLILVVDSLKKWHLKNIEMNPNDYSLIGRTYFKNADDTKLKGSTGITYLSNIEENDNTFKYGTIERLELQNHLYYWDSFYMPGRFQKAVYPIRETDGIQEAIKINREKALLVAAYLLKNEIVTKKELLTMICSLSYLGDTRMKFAENPKKIENIVNGSYNELVSIYNFNTDYFCEWDDEHIKIKLDKIKYAFTEFPISLGEYLANEEDKNKVLDYLTELNKKESIEQTIKGIKTNGVVKSINYGTKKLAKRFKR